MAFSLFKGRDKPGDPGHGVMTAERLLASGDIDAAKAAAMELVEAHPEDASARVVLGMALKEEGRLREALAAFEAAVARNPRHVEALTDLAAMCLELGLLEEANFIIGQAVKLAPGALATRMVQARALESTGRAEKAVQAYLAAAGAASTSVGVQEGLIGIVTRAPEFLPEPESADFEAVRRVFIAAFQVGQAETDALARAAGVVIARDYRLGAPDQKPIVDILETLSEDELFIRLLQETINVDPAVEAFCGRLRQHLLGNFGEEVELPVAASRLAGALALQAWHNEYATPCEEAELNVVEGVGRVIDSELASGKASPVALRGKLLLFAMYGPLSAHPRIDRILDLALGGEVQRVLALTVRERREVDAMRDRIPAIGATPPADAGARAHFEANPYPRWIHITRPEPRALGNYLRSRFPAYDPPAFESENLDVLVPGCGTGQHPIKTAMRFPTARVTAVDVSRDSLAYGARMARKLGVGNVTFALGDLMALPDQPERYHYIECTHLLHYVANHGEAWQALAALLHPGGVLKVDVPSKHGRADLAAARELVTRLTLSADAGGIKAARREILASSDATILPIRERADFYSASGCREMLFHVPVARYDLDAVHGMIAEHGLSLIGLFAEPLLRTAYRKACPDDPNMADRASLARFERENVLAPAGAYQLLCEKPA